MNPFSFLFLSLLSLRWDSYISILFVLYLLQYLLWYSWSFRSTFSGGGGGGVGGGNYPFHSTFLLLKAFLLSLC